MGTVGTSGGELGRVLSVADGSTLTLSKGLSVLAVPAPANPGSYAHRRAGDGALGVTKCAAFMLPVASAPLLFIIVQRYNALT